MKQKYVVKNSSIKNVLEGERKTNFDKLKKTITYFIRPNQGPVQTCQEYNKWAVNNYTGTMCLYETEVGK